MNVGELRSILLAYPDETKVLVSGYEYGFDDISNIELCKVEETKIHDPYAGKYDSTASEGAEIVLIIV